MPRTGLRVPSLLPILAAACGQPSDVLFTPTAVPPAEVEPGLYRVTWHHEADVVRGFTADGSGIIYQSRDLPGFGPGSYVLAVDLATGAVRDDAEIYRRALLDTVTHVVSTVNARLLVSWRSLEEGSVSCRLCPPPPPTIELHIRRLPPTGIVALPSIPTRVVALPNRFTGDVVCPDGEFGPNLFHRIRIRPAELEIWGRHANPFGPLESADGSAAFYSDGEAVWRYDPSDPSAPSDSVGPGIYPSLSPDGGTLAAAVPLGLDSVGGTCRTGLCCTQETIRMDATGWEVVLHDLNGGGSVVLGPGFETSFDPLAARVAVRRPDALYWVGRASGAAAEIPGTGGGYAPAIAPDGSVLAFTARRNGNADVYYVRIR